MRNMMMIAVVAVSFAATHALADVISFDPDGSAGANGTLSVGSFQFLTGNSLAVPSQIGGIYTQYGQARLGGVLDGDSNVNPITGINMPAGFEITVVTQYQGTVAPLGSSALQLGLDGSGTNFIRMYYDDAPDASDLLGTGFDNGTLIFEGTVTSAFGTLLINPTGLVQFDQFGADNYAGFQTPITIGGLSLTTSVDYIDSDFFLSSLLQLNLNTSSKTPFQETNPSQEFLGYTPNLGAFNGSIDTQLQTDANGSFIIPEPSSVALMGLAGIALLARRKRL